MLVRRISVHCFSGGEKRPPEIRLRLQARVLKTCGNRLAKTFFFSSELRVSFHFFIPYAKFPILYANWNTTILIITLKHLKWLSYARMSIGRFRIAFRANSKRQFVPRDQFFPFCRLPFIILICREISSFMPVSSLAIVLSCFYLLIF